MKKYLFGLGAMLVGAGLMFVLMHGEVSALDTDERVKMGLSVVVPEKEQDFLCRVKSISTYSSKVGDYVIWNKKFKGNPQSYVHECKIRDRKGNRTTCYMFMNTDRPHTISYLKG